MKNYYLFIVFIFRDELFPAQRTALFRLLERYSTAVAIVAFPLPPGYASFLAYLGFRVFSTEMFLQYAHRNALELNIDVMKAIMAGREISFTSIHHSTIYYIL